MTISFSFDEAQKEAVAAGRAFFGDYLTAERRARYRPDDVDRELWRALAASGWLTAAWPKQFGGRDADPVATAAFFEEGAVAGAAFGALDTTAIVAGTLMAIGTGEQQQELLPGIGRGEVLIALGYSEPSVGSDLSAVSTVAERDGDDWLVNGEKMFTTHADLAEYVFLLVRTDPEAGNHAGLTTLLCPLPAAGFEWSLVETLSGERTCATTFRDVRVPDRLRVGEVNGGWSVLGIALALERNAYGLAETLRGLQAVEKWARTACPGEDPPPIHDEGVRERLARIAIDAEVTRLLGQRATWLTAAGTRATVEGSMAKLFGTEAYLRAARELADLVGSDALWAGAGPGAGEVEQGVRRSPLLTIAGGSSEIQRQIIARRGLNLPPSR
jgi:alkylation response protein AidB-like acyl-CoA dehydrogenase